MGASACTTSLYPGPRRPTEEVALLTWSGAEVVKVDGAVLGMDRGWTMKLALLPGHHELTFTPDDAPSPQATACVDLEAGHHYRLEATDWGGWWHGMVDTDSDARVATSCDGRNVEDEPAEPIVNGLAKKRPGSGFSVFAGFGSGGDTLTTVPTDDGSETLKAGRGLNFGLGAMLTPLWLGKAVGLGAGVDLEVEGLIGGLQDHFGYVARFPLSLTAHVLTNFTGHSPNYLIARASVSRDLWGYYHVSDGDLFRTDTPLRSPWGTTFSAGFYRRMAPLLAFDISVFARFGDLDVGSTRVNANSFGVLLTQHFDF